MSIDYFLDSKGIVTLALDRSGGATNIIDEAFISALSAALQRLEQEKSLLGVIVKSAKATFLAGGDLRWLARVTDAAEAFAVAEQIKALFRRLERLGKPVVAVISGSALGGGMELALACHHRLVVDDPALRLGFPEVTLGLLPGGGGVLRTTRLLGLQAALPILMEGKVMTPQEALEAGLADRLAGGTEDLLALARAWIHSHPAPVQPWDAPGYRIPGGTPESPRVAQMLAIAPAMLRKKTYRNYPAPEAIISAAVEGASVDFDTASRIESRYFAEVATGRVAKNMINTFWFQLNQIKAGDSRPPGIPPSTVRNLGVLGAGMMGHGIAYAAAGAGIDVVLKDVTRERAFEGLDRIERLVNQGMAKGKLTSAQGQRVLARIKATAANEDLQGCDLVIEAIYEDRKLKARVTQEAEDHLEAGAIFASNTSTLPITSLASASTRPQQFIGLHFFSPVHKMKLVEIICGKETLSATLARAFDFVLQLGKTPIVVNDSRGFYTSRVFGTYLREGMALLAEGQNPRAIESAGLQAGMPVGPLALADEVGLDLMWHIREQTRADLAQEELEMEAHPGDPVLAMMTQELGRLGKAAGAGFYDYPVGGNKVLWPALREHFPSALSALPHEDMMLRLLAIQALEAARCYEEGVVRSAADANVGSVLGWGFAPFTGGVLQYINDFGLSRFVTCCHSLAGSIGERFRPPELLERMAREGANF